MGAESNSDRERVYIVNGRACGIWQNRTSHAAFSANCFSRMRRLDEPLLDGLAHERWIAPLAT